MGDEGGDPRDRVGGAAGITGGFFSRTTPSQRRAERAVVHAPPPWLMEPALRVLSDLQSPTAIVGLQITANPLDELNGLTLGLVEPTRVQEKMVVELADVLDPTVPPGPYGGNWVPRSLPEPDLTVHVADLLQHDLLLITRGQARPPCPGHPHPASPALYDGHAWWICPHDRRPLYRVGCGEVAAAGVST